MKTIKQKVEVKKSLRVLLVGNNPIELSVLLNQIQDVNEYAITTELAFDLRSLLERLKHFTPDCIFIDDNIGKITLQETTSFLQQNKKTKNIPVTVLKNSNYSEAVKTELTLDYLLKKGLTADRLYHVIVNTFKIKQAQHFLKAAYEKRKHLLTGYMHSLR
ncbi:MAG: response regulator [Cyclobacteriaceae bacterium]|jgi:CheY-like chemotaxis protein|nr:response regulator [Cyclobacteriaceae bacterium]